MALVATVPCENLRHKSNTFYTILALCTYLYRSHLGEPVSMKQTKHNRKSEAQIYVQNVHHSWTHAFKRLHHCAIAAAMMMVWSSSFHSLRRLLSTPSRHGSANGRPSLEGYPRFCSLPDSNLANWMATSLNWSDKLLASLSLCCMVTVSRARWTAWFQWRQWRQYYVTR